MHHSKNTNSAQPEVNPLQSFPSYPGEGHSFNVALAATYGISEAILINHFQFWIRINRRRGKNQVDGRCWTYQSRKDIEAHFPYLTYKMVRRICESLVKRGVLMTRTSTTGINRTLWYAFVDEEKFGVSERILNNVYEGPNGHIEGPNGHMYTDTITDTRKQQQQQSAREHSKKSAVPAAAAVSHSEKKERPRKKEDIPKPPPKPKVEPYECLKSLDMPDVDKQHITETYTESVVLHAVAWAMHPLTTLRKELAAAIKWACKTKPALPKESKSKEDKKRDDDVSRDNLIFQNRSYAQHLHTTLAKKIPSNRFFRIYDTHVELGCKKKLPSNGIETSTSLMPIGFAEPDFVIQVENQLRELGIDGTNTEYSKDAQKHP